MQFSSSTKDQSSMLGMSLSSLSCFGNNTGGEIDREASSTYTANMKMLNHLMMQYSTRHSHQQTNSRPSSQQEYQQQQLLLERFRANSSNPSHTPHESINLPPRTFPASNTFPAFSDGNQKAIKSVLKEVDSALFLAESLDFQDSNNYNSGISEKHPTSPFFQNQQCLEEETEEHDSLSHEDDATTRISGNENRFRHYQADQWTTMLEELMEYRRQHYHCNVPHTSKEFPTLGRWVKRQRYQYKLMLEGKKESTMTPERAQILEQIGFVWDAHTSTWHRRFRELHDFFVDQGHCNVPSNFPPNPQLSTWVKFQRRQYKALQKGSQCQGRGATGQSLTPTRIRALEELGFQWELRRNRNVKK